jgi:hypothetical protein
LLVDAAQVEPLLRPVEELVAGFSTDDVEQRLADLIGTLMPILLSEEPLLRTTMRVYMDTWLENRRNGHDTPVRARRRARFLDQALAPIRRQLGETDWKRLRSALTLTLGTEAVTSMKDVAGLADDDEIVATLRWAASALLRTALNDAAHRRNTSSLENGFQTVDCRKSQVSGPVDALPPRKSGLEI